MSSSHFHQRQRRLLLPHNFTKIYGYILTGWDQILALFGFAFLYRLTLMNTLLVNYTSFEKRLLSFAHFWIRSLWGVNRVAENMFSHPAGWRLLLLSVQKLLHLMQLYRRPWRTIFFSTEKGIWLQHMDLFSSRSTRKCTNCLSSLQTRHSIINNLTF